MSVASMGRRLGALFIDWLLCELIVSAWTHHALFSAGPHDPSNFTTLYWTTALFAFEVCLLTAISGLTVGKRLLGIRVIRTDGRRPGIGWAFVRTLLLLLLLPAVLYDSDRRGLHDRASDTIVVKM